MRTEHALARYVANAPPEKCNVGHANIMIKRILIGVGITVLVVAIALMLLIRQGMHRLRLEDEVPHIYVPVMKAIWNFTDSNGVAPSALSDLVPAFLPALPTSPVVEAVSYQRMEDRTNWVLSIRAKVGHDRWTYLQETVPQRESRKVKRIHGWQIIEEEK